MNAAAGGGKTTQMPLAQAHVITAWHTRKTIVNAAVAGGQIAPRLLANPAAAGWRSPVTRCSRITALARHLVALAAAQSGASASTTLTEAAKNTGSSYSELDAATTTASMSG